MTEAADFANITPEDVTGEDIEPHFPTVELWVNELFVPVFVRPIGAQFRWCAKWWAHAEATMRFEALWRTWELARLDEIEGMATWLRDHLDHQLPILMDPLGTFARCSPQKHEPVTPLPTEPVPAEIYAS